jgi:hypothetical protein
MSQLIAMMRADRAMLASAFVSTEETRYYLNGIHLSPMPGGGMRIAATNGHYLGVFKEDVGFTDAERIVKLPADCLAALKKLRSYGNAWLGLFPSEDSKLMVRVVDLGVDPTPGSAKEALAILESGTPNFTVWQGFADLIDGTFPDYSRLMPYFAEKDSAPAWFNPAYLATFAKVCAVSADGSKKRVGGSLMVRAQSDGPAFIECGREDFVGVLMPMRGYGEVSIVEDGFRSAPDWARGVAPSEKTAVLRKKHSVRSAA